MWRRSGWVVFSGGRRRVSTNGCLFGGVWRGLPLQVREGVYTGGLQLSGIFYFLFEPYDFIRRLHRRINAVG